MDPVPPPSHSRPMFCGTIIEEEEDEEDDEDDGGRDGEYDEDYDDDAFLAEKLKEDVAALRRACQLSGLPNFPDPVMEFEDEDGTAAADDDYDDDDKLLLAIQNRFGGVPSTFPSHSSANEKPWIKLDEEDDDEILRLVEQRASAMFRLHRTDEESSHLKIASERVKATSNEDDVVVNVDSLGSDDSRALVSVNFFTGTGTGISSDAVAGNEALGTELSLQFPVQAETHNDRDDGNPEEPAHASREKVPPILPESLRLVFDALKKNRLFQRVLRSKLVQVEAKLKNNTKLTQRVMTVNKYEKICKQRYTAYFSHTMNASVQFISLPKKRGRNLSSSKNHIRKDQGPPENEDVAKFRLLPKKFPLNFKFRRWTAKESNELGKGVKQQVQEHLINSVIEQFSKDNTGNLELFDEQVQAVAGKPFTAAEIHSSLPYVNWNEVARVYVINRSAVECQAQWLQHEDPSIHHGPWTKAEDKRLLSIAQRLNLCNWDVIATELGTRRTAAQCLTRYQRSLNAGIMRGNWTSEEDMQLRAAVERCGANDWMAVAAYMEGRNGSQCFNRWYHILHPWRKKSGKWSDEEDKRLICAVSVHGPRKWKVIASYVEGRTEVQCRERWSNVLNPSLKFDMWTEEEDKKLEEAVAKYGLHHWSFVAKEIQPRTDNQCWRRWKILHPEILCEFWKHVRIQKCALISNFVGRRKERPVLGPNDFTIREGDESSRYWPDSMKRRKKAGGGATKKGRKVAGAASKKGRGCGIQAEQSDVIAEDGSVLVQRKAAGVRRKKRTYGSGVTQDDVTTAPADDIPAVATKWRRKLIAIRKKGMEESINGVLMPQLNDMAVSIDNAASLVTKKRGRKSAVKGDRQMEESIVGAPIELNNVASSVDNGTSLVMKKKGRKPTVKGEEQIKENIVDAPIELNNVEVSIDDDTSFVAKKRGRKPNVKGDKQIEENIVDAPMELNNVAAAIDNGTSLVMKKRGRKPKVKGEKHMEENIVGAPIELNNIAVSIDNGTSLVTKKRGRKPKVKGEKKMEENIIGASIELNNIAVSIDNGTSLVVRKRVRKPKVRGDKQIEENIIDVSKELNNVAVSTDNGTSLAVKKRRRKLAVKGDKEMEALSIDDGTSLVTKKRGRKPKVKGEKKMEENHVDAPIELNNIAVSIDNGTSLVVKKRVRKPKVKGDKQIEENIVDVSKELNNVAVSTDDGTSLAVKKRHRKPAVKGDKEMEEGIIDALIGLNNAAVSIDNDTSLVANKRRRKSALKGDKGREEDIFGALIELNNVAVTIDNDSYLALNKRRKKSTVKGNETTEESIIGAPIELNNVAVSIDSGVIGEKQTEESIAGAPIKLNNVAVSIDSGVNGDKQTEESIAGAPIELNNVAVSIDSGVNGEKQTEESIAVAPIKLKNVSVSIDDATSLVGKKRGGKLAVKGGKQTEKGIVSAPIGLNNVAVSTDNGMKGHKQVEESIVGALIELNNVVSIDNNTSLVVNKKCRKSVVKGDKWKEESIVGAPIEPINVTISIDNGVNGDKQTEESIVGAPIKLNNVALSIDNGVKGDKQMEESIIGAPTEIKNDAVSIDNTTSLLANKRHKKSVVKWGNQTEEDIVGEPIKLKFSVSVDNGAKGDKQMEESIAGAPIKLKNAAVSIDKSTNLVTKNRGRKLEVKGDKQTEESIAGSPIKLNNVAVSIDHSTSLVVKKRVRKLVIKGDKQTEESIVGVPIELNNVGISTGESNSLVVKKRGRKLEVKGHKRTEESIVGPPVELNNVAVSIDQSTSLVVKKRCRKPVLKVDKRMEEGIIGVPIELNNVPVSIDKSTSLVAEKRGRKPTVKGDKQTEDSIVSVPIKPNNAVFSIDNGIKGGNRTEESIISVPIELSNVAVSIDNDVCLRANKRGRKFAVKGNKQKEGIIVNALIKLDNVDVSIDNSVKGDKQMDEGIELNNAAISIDNGTSLVTKKRGRQSVVKGENRTEESIVGELIELNHVGTPIDNSGAWVAKTRRSSRCHVEGENGLDQMKLDSSGSKKAKEDGLSQVLHKEERTRRSGCSANEIQNPPNDSVDICAEGKEMESVIDNEYGMCSHQPKPSRRKVTKNPVQRNSEVLHRNTRVLRNGKVCKNGNKAEGVSWEEPDKQVVNCAVEEMQKEAIDLETEPSKVACDKGSSKVSINSYRAQLTKDDGMQDNSRTVLQNSLSCDSGATQKSENFAPQDGGGVGAKNYQEIEKVNDNVSASSALQEEASTMVNGDLINSIGKPGEEADGSNRGKMVHSTVVIPHDIAVAKRQHSTPSRWNSGRGNEDEKPIGSLQKKLVDSHERGNEVVAVSSPLIRRSNRNRAPSEKALMGWHLK